MNEEGKRLVKTGGESVIDSERKKVEEGGLTVGSV